MPVVKPELTLYEYVKQLPKAELHLHLEGSVEAQTIQEIQPGLTLGEIQTAMHFSGFLGFLKAYVWVSQRLTTATAYRVALRRLLEKLISQNVLAVEITLSVGVILWKGQTLEAIFEALCEECAAHPTIRVHWIFDAIRQFGAEQAAEVFEKAAAYRDSGVVAIGIGGDEERGPAIWFADLYHRAKDAGLCLTAHAGETTGPESVWQAIKIGAQRIGHGIRAVEDGKLMAYLREHAIALEVCPSSNVATAAVRSLEEHPLRQLWEAGVPIVLGTDDPALFATNLGKEYALAAEKFGFSREELCQLATNSFRFSFDRLSRELGRRVLPTAGE